MNIRVLLLLALLLPLPAFGHSLSSSYLNLEIDGQHFSGHLQLAVQDLELSLGLDEDQNGDVTWGEISRNANNIERFVRNGFSITQGGNPCTYTLSSSMINELNAGTFVYLPISGQCHNAGELQLDYRLMFDIDASHRAIATVTAGEAVQSLLFSPNNPSVTLNLSAASIWSHYYHFILEGIWHIWIGLDHILFLVALILPLVIGYRNEPVMRRSHGAIARDILLVVSAFTIAHSITLILASLNVVSLSSRLVESIIALSVAISGINVIYPIFLNKHWQIAFGFGLIHGFGFAGVLGDLTLPTEQFVSALLSFNIGVEIGQLVIVALLVPTLLLMSNPRWLGRATALATGSAIAGLGSIWVLERYWGISAYPWV